jgi:hypothetical protein
MQQSKLLERLLAVSLSIALSAPAWALTTPLVIDGDLWMSSSLEVRKAFLVGVSNMITLESAYSKKKDTPAPVAGALMTTALDGLTLDEISSRVSKWYEANPGRRNMPVTGVIWVDMVKPASGAK